jgi:hypothetical protein
MIGLHSWQRGNNTTWKWVFQVVEHKNLSSKANVLDDGDLTYINFLSLRESSIKLKELMNVLKWLLVEGQ